VPKIHCLKHLSISKRIFSKTYLFVVIVITAISCSDETLNNSWQELEDYDQPASFPIQFETPKPIIWGDSSVSYKPNVVPINYKLLPESIFDSTGFRRFASPPSKIPLNWEGLPTFQFNLDTLPVTKLQFDNWHLPPPQLIKCGTAKLQPIEGELVFDLGEPLDKGFVTALLKAKNGLTWVFINGRGLYSYDGTHAYHYQINQLTSPAVSMVEDDAGQIWIATYAQGLVVLNVANNTVKHTYQEMGLTGNVIKFVSY
jgi:hypothetical protein